MVLVTFISHWSLEMDDNRAFFKLIGATQGLLKKRDLRALYTYMLKYSGKILKIEEYCPNHYRIDISWWAKNKNIAPGLVKTILTLGPCK